jgi:hypothetical protein
MKDVAEKSRREVNRHRTTASLFTTFSAASAPLNCYRTMSLRTRVSVSGKRNIVSRDKAEETPQKLKAAMAETKDAPTAPPNRRKLPRAGNLSEGRTGNRIWRAETKGSKRPRSFKGAMAETWSRTTPPIRRQLARTGKSLRKSECVVGPGGLEPPTKRL